MVQDHMLPPARQEVRDPPGGVQQSLQSQCELAVWRLKMATVSFYALKFCITAQW